MSTQACSSSLRLTQSSPSTSLHEPESLSTSSWQLIPSCGKTIWKSWKKIAEKREQLKKYCSLILYPFGRITWFRVLELVADCESGVVGEDSSATELIGSEQHLQPRKQWIVLFFILNGVKKHLNSICLEWYKGFYLHPYIMRMIHKSLHLPGAFNAAV